MEPLLLSAQEAAGLLGLGRTTVFELIRRGEIESVKIGKKTRRIPMAAVRDFVERAREAHHDKVPAR